MDREDWRVIEGFDDRFVINPFGEVKNLSTGNYIKGRKISKDRSVGVRLSYDGKKYTKSLVKMLADIFIPNPNNYNYALLKDNNKPVQVDNIEWSYNTGVVLLEKGTVFGDLAVVEDFGMDYSYTVPKHLIKCSCKCGAERNYKYTDLNTGKIDNCGCRIKEIVPLDVKLVNNKVLKDPKVKKYVVEEIAAKRAEDNSIKRTVKVKCRHCQEESITHYHNYTHSKYSCWNCFTKSDSYTNRNKTHGLSRHPLYTTYTAMNVRCYTTQNRDYKNYGGRGIKICDEWKNDFLSFYKWAVENGWKKHLTIDRIDNDGNYEPSNCRWTSRAVQNRNQRQTKMDWDKVDDIRSSSLSNKELAEKYEVHIMTIQNVKNYHTWKKREV